MDPDSISKGKVAYKVVGVNSPSAKKDAFSVDGITGKITTRTVFDREAGDRYILTLFAEDHTSNLVLRTAFCVAVDIKDANDRKPRFVSFL